MTTFILCFLSGGLCYFVGHGMGYNEAMTHVRKQLGIRLQSAHNDRARAARG